MKKILVIEDDLILRTEISTILQFEGYNVLEADNGLTGLKLAVSLLPDLILCDIMMPEMDGIQVLIEVRETKSSQLIPFVLLTALAERSNLRLGMESGANDYITKPFTRMELLNAISVQLEKAKSINDNLENELLVLREKIISKIPHEINTPLHGILGFSSILEEDSHKIKKTDIKIMAGYITQSGKRLLSMVERYNYFIKLLASKNTRGIDPKHCSTPELIISSIIASITTDYKRPEDIEFSLEDGDIIISDKEFATLLRELIDNAYKFSTPKEKIYIKSVCDEKYYSLSIQDFGRGISNKDLRRIGAFQQFDREIYEQQGTGLGLAISKLIVELNGGIFNIKSEINEGTTITIKIPNLKSTAPKISVSEKQLQSI